MSARPVTLWLLLIALPAFAAAKPKVVVDAPAPLKAMISKEIAKKYAAVNSPKKLTDEPSANEVIDATTKAGTKALIIGRIQGGLITVQVLDGYDGSPLGSFRFKAPAGKRKLKALPKGSGKRLEEGLRGARGPQPKKAEPVAEVAANESLFPDEKPPKREEPEKREAPVKKEEPRERARATERRASREVEPRVEKPLEPEEEAPGPSAPVLYDSKLRIGATARAFTRRFFYRDDVFKALGRYDLAIGPAAGVELEVYPLAFFRKDILSNIGLAASFDTAFGISSATQPEPGPDGKVPSCTSALEAAGACARYRTNALRLKVGATMRLTLGPVDFTPTLGYAMQSFAIVGSATAPKLNIPAVSYGALRVGANVRFRFLEKWAFHLGGAYQKPLSTGEIGSRNYFPQLVVHGMDASAALSYALFRHFEIRAGIDYTRFGYKMNPKLGDTYVAGGALDDYRGMSLLLSYTL